MIATKCETNIDKKRPWCLITRCPPIIVILQKRKLRNLVFLSSNFSAKRTHAHTLHLILYVALNQIKLLSRKYTYCTTAWTYFIMIVVISHLHVVHHCEVAQSIGKLHQNCRQRDNETTPLLEGVPAQKRKRMFHCCQILVQLGKGGLQRAF